MKRKIYGAAFVLLLSAEVLIALFVRDRFVRPYIGDVLVTVLLCCLLRCVFPEKPKLLPLYVFLFSAAAELSQLFALADRIGGGAFLNTVLGATFDPADLACYAAGCACVFAAEAVIRRRAAGAK